MQLKRRQHWLFSTASAFAVSMGSTLLAGAFTAPAAARELKVGDKLPAFTLTDINGKVIKSAHLKNRVHLRRVQCGGSTFAEGVSAV